MGACAGKGLEKDVNEAYLPKSKINKNELIDELNNNESQNIENDEYFDNIKSKNIENYRKSYMNANYKRNSFDRFGDDFCELILSYLCLEDKMRFECLNSQWNRCIFSRVYEIDYPLERIFSWNFDEKQKLIISKKLLKKCKFVRKLKISPVCNNEILKLVSDNCRYIEIIDMRFDNLKPIRRDILNSFVKNCGPKLRNIKISELSEDSFDSESGISLLIVFSEYFFNIQEIELSIDSDKCLKYFTLLTDFFSDRIKVLKLRLKFNSRYLQIEETFGQISRFENLRNIDLKIECEKNLELNFSEGVKTWAKSFKNLRNISLEINGEIYFSTNLLECFESISKLDSLKLIIRQNKIKFGSFASLKNISNLALLNILYSHLNDNLLNDIHLYCPKLVSIELSTTDSITDITMRSLSKIENLKSVKISGIPYSVYGITDSGVCSILNNCKDIRRIIFNCGINITQLTFNTLIELAKNDKRRIKFSFCWKRSQKHSREFFCSKSTEKFRKDSIEELMSPEDTPENLIIESREYFVGWCGTMMMNEIYQYRKQFSEYSFM